MKRVLISSSSGLTLVELLLSSGLTSFMSLGLGVVMIHMAKESREADLTNALLTTRIETLKLILNENNLEASINYPANVSFACLSNFSSCPSESQVSLINAEDNVPYDFIENPATAALGQYQGISYDGKSCVSSSPDPDESCPVRIRLVWEPLCDVDCSNAQIIWRATYTVFQNSNMRARNTSRYTLVYRMNYDPNGVIVELKASYGACILYASGRMKCWGSDFAGQLGRGTVGVASGTPGWVLRGPAQPLQDVVQIQHAEGTICARHGSGNLTCWGENQYGQAGRGLLASNAAQPNATGPIGYNNISYADQFVVNSTNTGPLTNIDFLYSGENSQCARETGGNIYCWGMEDRYTGNNRRYNVPANYNGDYHEGLGEPYSAPATHSRSYSTPGLLTGPDWPLPPFTDIRYLDNAESVMCIIWGPNSEVGCWGSSRWGRLGIDEDSVSISRIFDPVRKIPAVGVPLPAVGSPPADTLKGAHAVSIGLKHSCAVVGPNRNVACWGSNQYGQLGDGGPVNILNVGPYPLNYVVSPTGVGLLRDIDKMLVHDEFTCALNTSGEVYCWGRNSEGELGSATGTHRSLPVRVNLPAAAIQIALGTSNGCALLNNQREVYCWGANTTGQIGMGTVGGTPSYPPTRVIGL